MVSDYCDRLFAKMVAIILLSVSMPLVVAFHSDSVLGHVTCLGDWDNNKHET